MAVILDQDTEKQLSDSEEIRLMTQGRGWSIVRDKLNERILDLQNINNLPDADPAVMMNELKARVLASKLIFAFLKEDVYGAIEQGEASRVSVIEKKENNYIDLGKG